MKKKIGVFLPAVFLIVIVVLGLLSLTRLHSSTWGTAKFKFDKKTNTMTFVKSGKLGTAASKPVYAGRAEKVVIKPGVRLTAPENAGGLFSHFRNTKEFVGLNRLKTDHVKNMSGMFQDDHSLEKIDISSFKTHHVNNMAKLFKNDLGLKTINVAEIDTSKVEHMNGMFQSDHGIKTLNIGHFKTNKVVDMSNMFRNDYHIKNFSLINFRTGKVHNMTKMFAGNKRLLTLNISSFNTHKVKKMKKMFAKDKSLREIVIGSKTKIKKNAKRPKKAKLVKVQNRES